MLGEGGCWGQTFREPEVVLQAAPYWWLSGSATPRVGGGGLPSHHTHAHGVQCQFLVAGLVASCHSSTWGQCHKNLTGFLRHTAVSCFSQLGGHMSAPLTGQPQSRYQSLFMIGGWGTTSLIPPGQHVACFRCILHGFVAGGFNCYVLEKQVAFSFSFSLGHSARCIA